MVNAKYISKIINILVFIAGLISFLGVEGLKGIIPTEYQYLIPTIIMVAGYILVQLSEDARVSRAEELVSQSGGVSNGTKSQKL